MRSKPQSGFGRTRGSMFDVKIEVRHTKYIVMWRLSMFKFLSRLRASDASTEACPTSLIALLLHTVQFNHQFHDHQCCCTRRNSREQAVIYSHMPYTQNPRPVN